MSLRALLGGIFILSALEHHRYRKIGAPEVRVKLLDGAIQKADLKDSAVIKDQRHSERNNPQHVQRSIHPQVPQVGLCPLGSDPHVLRRKHYQVLRLRFCLNRVFLDPFIVAIEL